ncbi:MAG: hypothetical protein ACOC0D_03895 [Spirochaeta sp.]
MAGGNTHRGAGGFFLLDTAVATAILVLGIVIALQGITSGQRLQQRLCDEITASAALQYSLITRMYSDNPGGSANHE